MSRILGLAAGLVFGAAIITLASPTRSDAMPVPGQSCRTCFALACVDVMQGSVDCCYVIVQNRLRCFGCNGACYAA
jgi:hypothetical protein